jgi:cytochrome c-type biogenesis protein
VPLENITIVAAFAGGILSFLSPCVLPLLPVFSAILAESVENTSGNWTIYRNAGCFFLGFTLVFIIMGATASFLGQWFFDYQPEIRKIGALLIILMGFSLSGLLHLGPFEREYRPLLSRTFHGPYGAFLLGISFTVGWTPCTGPVLASILLYAGGNTTVGNGILLLFIYAMGFSVPFFLLAVILRKYLTRVRKVYRWLPQIQKAAGYMLVIIGLFLWLDWIQKGLGIFWSIFS